MLRAVIMQRLLPCCPALCLCALFYLLCCCFGRINDDISDEDDDDDDDGRTNVWHCLQRLHKTARDHLGSFELFVRYTGAA